MIEFRWVTEAEEVQGIGESPRWEKVRRLQYRLLFNPYRSASGEIVLDVNNDPAWVNVPEESP